MFSIIMLTNIQTIKHICARRRIKPDKNFGQNFLIDEKVLHDIVSAAELQKTDTVIEIGAGLGTLTSALAEKAGHVYAFEVDPRLYPVLQETVPQKNVEIIKENIVRTRARLEQIILSSGRFQNFFSNGERHFSGNYKIVANIPYSITGILARLFTELTPPPARTVVMVQKEVADRITARAGRMSMLAVATQYYAAPKFVRSVPKTSFFPAPKVDSAVIAWEPSRAYNQRTDEPFFRFVRAGFAHPRKMLKNNLVENYKALNFKMSLRQRFPMGLTERDGASRKVSLVDLSACMRKSQIKDTARPGDLTVDDWLRLSARFVPK